MKNLIKSDMVHPNIADRTFLEETIFTLFLEKAFKIQRLIVKAEVRANWCQYLMFFTAMAQKRYLFDFILVFLHLLLQYLQRIIPNIGGTINF